MLLNFFFLDNNKRSYRTSHAKHGKLNDKRMTKPFAPNIRLVNLVIFKPFTGIFKHFSLVTIVEAPWFESCALWIYPLMEREQFAGFLKDVSLESQYTATL